MKTLLFCLLVSIQALGFGQSDSTLVYTTAASIPGASKAALLQRAESWFSDSSKNAKFSLEKENKETGEVEGKGYMLTKLSVDNKTMDSKITYTLHVKVIDQRYMLRVSDFVHEYVNQEFTGFGLLTASDINPVKQGNYTRQTMNELWKQVKEDVALRVDPLMDKFNVYMKKKAVSTL